ncbi:MAG: hypothetical protein H6P94_86 [Thermoplasmatales archaeon]|nr:hypothetical protein [Thermoplasmatales archaeon]
MVKILVGNTCTEPGYQVYNNSLIMKAREWYLVRTDEYPLGEGVEKRV